MSLNNVSWLVLYTILYNIKDSFILCRIVYSVTTYFMMATYFWMLCEGIFLRALTIHIIPPDYIKRWLICLGWAGPLLVVVPYIYSKHHFKEDLCWMDHSDGFSGNIILAIPTVLILGLNKIILILTLRTICINKANSLNRNSESETDPNCHAIHIYKYVKPVLILTVVLGLQFYILPTRPSPGSDYEYLYEVISCLSTSTQGIYMSVLLCFSNRQIVALLKAKMKNTKEQLIIRTRSQRSRRNSIELNSLAGIN